MKRRFCYAVLMSLLVIFGCGGGESKKVPDDRVPSDVKPGADDSTAMAEMEAKLVLKSMDVAIRDYQDADIELNKLWDKLKSALDDSEMAALTQKQIAWIQQKESACKEEADKEFTGPKPETLEDDPYWISVNYFCLASKTINRIAELEKILENTQSPR